MSANHTISSIRVSSCIHWLALLFIALCSITVPIKQTDAATVPVGFQDQRLATGITSPTTLTVLPDGRVLAVQQNGVIRMIKGDVMLGTNFWSVPNVNGAEERGCLGIVPDPDFPTNHFVYIYCTINNATGHNNRVIRVTEANDKVVAGSEQVIFQLPNVPGTTRWHMGGALKFGPDGKLYIGVGNHEDSPQNPSNSQRLTNPFGKILRINKDGSIPSDNPYASRTDAGRSIWNLGHRNPFAYDIQPGTGRMFIGDVGQNTWEEVNDGIRDGNYGWPFFEGTQQRIAPPAGFQHRVPFYRYGHSEVPSTIGCASVTGVAFYNPPVQQFPESYRGKVLFQEFCGGHIKLLNPAATGGPPYPSYSSVTTFASGISFPTNMAVAPNGSLYYLARNQRTGTPNPGGGSLHKITFTASQAPRCNLFPDDVTVSVGQSATFTSGADGATSLQWQRADSATPTSFSNITGATGTSFTLTNAQLSDNGDKFQMRATNSFGSVNCGPATLTVTANRFPTATINSPADGTMFRPGQTIAYSGVGTDPEDGTLPASRLKWQVDILHDGHVHPSVPEHTGSGGSFTDGGVDALEPNMWYQILMTATDSGGLQSFAIRDVYPDKQLSSMNPMGTPINGLGPVERNMSNGGSGAGDGRPMQIAGITYNRGWGAHAPSEMVFDIAGCTGEFLSHVGVDDEVIDLGSVVFQVYLDDVLAWQSNLLTGVDTRELARVSVAGKSRLKLVVTDGGDGNSSDHANWAGARVTGCTSTTPTYEEAVVPASAVTASANDGNVPANTVDNNLATRWSASGDPQWIRFDLGAPKTVGHVKIAFFKGNERQSRFDLQLSDDGVNFRNVRTNVLSSGTSLAEETFDFPDETARYVRYFGHGNTVNLWNSLTEVSIFVQSSGGGGPAMHWIEAESGTISAPMQTVSDVNASSGSAIQVAAGNNSTAAAPTTGIARYTVSVTQAGTYKLWGRVLAPANTDDSFWVRVNGGTWARWNGLPLGTAYQWDDVHSDLVTGSPAIQYNLSVGTTTIEVGYREDGARLDKLLLTNDLSFVPTGTGN